MNRNKDVYEELDDEFEWDEEEDGEDGEDEKPIPGTRQRPSCRKDGTFDGPPYGDIQIPESGWW